MVISQVRDLGSSLDQVTVLGQLGGHGHVHKLVCNAHLKDFELVSGNNTYLPKSVNYTGF